MNEILARLAELTVAVEAAKTAFPLKKIAAVEKVADRSLLLVSAVVSKMEQQERVINQLVNQSVDFG